MRRVSAAARQSVAKIALLGLFANGCTVQTTAPAAAPCDPVAVDWTAPNCVNTTCAGVYARDQRLVCPQADGTEWETRTVQGQDGNLITVYQKYTPFGAPGTPAAHIIDSTLCLVTADGRVLVSQ